MSASPSNNTTAEPLEPSGSPSSASEAPMTLTAPAPRTLGLLDQLGFWGNLGVSLLGFAGALSILTPFLAYWPPESLGGSGVLATVTAGLYISWNGLRLISASTRLQGIFFWEFFIYLIEGMVFLITGLQARTLIARIGHYSISELVISAVIITLVVIVARFVWLYPATYLPRWLSPSLRRRDPSPPWQWPFALAFTGVRGIVSLAAALAIPFATESGAPFPAVMKLPHVGRGDSLESLLAFEVESMLLPALHGSHLPRFVAAGGIAHALVERFLFRGCAEDFRHLGLGFQLEHLLVAYPRLGVSLRVGERHREFQGVAAHTAVALLKTHLVTVRIAEVIEPSLLRETVGLDDERVAIPAAHRVSQPARIEIGIVGQLAAVGPNGAPDVAPF